MSRLVFYNAGPPSKTRPRDASRDVGGLLHEYRPRALVTCEVVGDRLQPQPGYAMVRDTSRPGRANVAAFVREDCELRRTWWIDHRTRWSKTNPGATGLHAARSSLVLGIGELQLLGAHNVPLGTDMTHEGQLEIVHALELVMCPWRRPRIRDHAPELSQLRMRERPRVLLWDDNAPVVGGMRRGLGADYMAHRIRGQRHGNRIDNGVERHAPVDSCEYVEHADGHHLATDHPWGALVLHLERGAIKWRLS